MTPDSRQPTPAADDDDATRPCDPLDWDTQFFGRPIARVRGHTLTPGRAAEIDAWCRRTGTSVIYFLAAADDTPTIRAAESAGFRLTEIRMTFDRAVPPAPQAPPAAPGGLTVRAFRESDLPALRDIARASYTDSRFYQDSSFPPEKADEMFDVWTTKLARQAPDGVLVADAGGHVAGYVACERVPADAALARLTLIAVAASHRGRGAGRALVESALAWAGDRGLTRMELVTHGRNVAAQRLYQRCGFVTRSVHVQYHKSYASPAVLSPVAGSWIPHNPSGPGL